MPEERSHPNPIEFRKIMGHYPTGVTIVTTTDAEGNPLGFTANSVTSVSLDPPLVLVCLSKDSSSLGPIMASETFTVNILDAGSANLATLFARSDERHRRFEKVDYFTEPGGNPVLEHGTAWLACSLFRTFEAGDHIVLVGKVRDGEARDGEPLLYFQGQFGRLMR